MGSPILPKFDRAPHAMREEAYDVKILMLRDELLKLKAISRRKDDELTKLKPLLGALNREREDHHRTLQELYAVQENFHEQIAELGRANRQHWAHLDRFHKEAQKKNQRLTKTGDELRCLRWVFEVRGEELTRLQDHIVELCSNKDKISHQLKEKSEDAEKSHRRFHETNQQMAKLQNRFVEKQRKADKKGEPEKDRGDDCGTLKSVDEETERNRRKERTHEEDGGDAGGMSKFPGSTLHHNGEEFGRGIDNCHHTEAMIHPGTAPTLKTN
jgi:chromosome segregation ATPase